MGSYCSLASAATMVSVDEPAAPAPSATEQERSQSFQPVTGGPEMQSGEMLLVEAYTAIWLLAFGLVLASLRRQRKLDERIQRLEDDLDKARTGASKPAVEAKGADGDE